MVTLGFSLSTQEKESLICIMKLYLKKTTIRKEIKTPKRVPAEGRSQGSSSLNSRNKTWWLRTVIPVHENQRQKDCPEFKVSLGYRSYL